MGIGNANEDFAKLTTAANDALKWDAVKNKTDFITLITDVMTAATLDQATIDETLKRANRVFDDPTNRPQIDRLFKKGSQIHTAISRITEGMQN